MTSLRKTAFVAGVLYLITYLAIPTLALYGPVLSDPDFIVGTDASPGVLWGAVLELIVALAIVGTGVVLFPVLRRQEEAVALGFVTSRLFEAGVITVGIISVLSIVTLQQEVGATAVPDAGALPLPGQGRRGRARPDLDGGQDAPRQAPGAPRPRYGRAGAGRAPGTVCTLNRPRGTTPRANGSPASKGSS